MPIRDEFNAKAERLKTFLQEVTEQVSQESGFVKRRSKITSSHFVQVMILGCLENPKATLSSFCQVSAALSVPISEPGWHDRINGEAVMKVQISWDYLRGQLNALTVTDGKTPDQRCPLPVQFATPGSLTLMDLGYFDQERLHQIGQQQAFFISRLHPQVGLYRQVADDLALDLSQVLADPSLVERELSWFKAFQVWQRFAYDLIMVVEDHWHDLDLLLRRVERHFQRFALKTQRRKSPSTFTLLLHLGA